MLIIADFRALRAPVSSAPMSRKLLEHLRVAAASSSSATFGAAGGGDGVVDAAGGTGVVVAAAAVLVGRNEDLRVESVLRDGDERSSLWEDRRTMVIFDASDTTVAGDDCGVSPGRWWTPGVPGISIETRLVRS
jgi:hypothetical protein